MTSKAELLPIHAPPSQTHVRSSRGAGGVKGHSVVPQIGKDTARRIQRYGTIIMIVTLLFAIKYLLIAIHFNIRDLDRHHHEGLSQGGKSAIWQQYSMVGRGTYGYVQYSSYRVSSSEIVAIGFGAVILKSHRKIGPCVWHSDTTGEIINGSTHLLYPGYHEDQQYEVILIRCQLNTDVEAAGGGHLVTLIDNEHVVLYREDPGAVLLNTPGEKPRTRLTMCVAPITTPVASRRLEEWIVAHLALGAEHVVAYDAGGLDSSAANGVKRFVSQGVLTWTSMRDVTHFQLAKAGMHLLAMHDCLYRSVLASDWVAFGGWDDYLQPRQNKSLDSILLANQEASFLTHGSMWWATQKCSPGWLKMANNPITRLQSPLQRMVFRWSHPFCHKEKGEEVDATRCPREKGHRFIIAKPQEVQLLGPHDVLEPKGGGVVLSTEVLIHNHYEGLHTMATAKTFCSEVHNDDEIVDWWVRDRSFADALKTGFRY